MSDNFELGKSITIRKTVVGPLENNVWLITQKKGPAVLIDAADNANEIKELIADENVGVIITTHRHHDHIGALKEMVESTNADLLAGTLDCDSIEEQSGIRPDNVWQGDVIELGDISLSVINLYGHTPGSIALILEQEEGPTYIFTGDSLFPGGPGKTSNSDDFQSLMSDLEEKIFDVYPDDTIILPGHGAHTNLGAERSSLGDWWERGW